MSNYQAPLRDIHFVIKHIADMEAIAQLPGFEEATPDLIAAILDEAAKFCEELIAPTNHPADQQGARIEEKAVMAADGLTDIYRQLVEGGWLGLSFSKEWSGQGFPAVLALAVQEMMMSSNLAFSLCPMLTYGATEAINAHASEAIKNTYLAKLISGEWTGTMNLTEPQAGTDLAAITCKAEPAGDHYLITGQKIFITWGDHDMTDNIVHLVLARLPDAPAGVKGISLFLVPKYLVNSDGSLGQRNDAYAVSLEHKLGIHASPTCVMSFGDGDGAVGYLVGEANNGLACMFTMMNHARLTVGLQGVALSERAYQQAVSYAKERVQGPVGGQAPRAPILHHPDVRRMLMLMKSLTEAGRALAYTAMASFDHVHASDDSEARGHHRRRVDLLTPIVKGWCTEIAQEVTSLGVQVHGGMGFIEETGAAQHYRDARILPIYEGTNGIQSLDLIGRKFLRDRGEAMSVLVAEIQQLVSALASHEQLSLIASDLSASVECLQQANSWILANEDEQQRQSHAVAFNYLMLTGTVLGGWLLAKESLQALFSHSDDPQNCDFYQAKITTTRFYYQHVLPRAQSYLKVLQAGSEAVMALDAEHFCL